MRKWFIIGTLVMVYLVCSSRSCTEDRSAWEARQLAWIEACQDSIISQFDKEKLSGLDLVILEETAAQRLGEWSDCMMIASDSTLGMPFREQARDFARSLFMSLNEAINLEDSVILWGNLFPEPITIEKSLTPIHDSLYIGSLHCRLIQQDSTKLIKEIPYRTIPFCVARTIRVFGTDTVRLWNVFLGR